MDNSNLQNTAEQPAVNHETISVQNDFSSANNDWFGTKYINNIQEVVSYRNNSTVRIWYNREPYGFQMHWHSALEIIMPLDNYYDITVNKEHFRVHPGEFFVIPPRELHELIAPSKGTRFVFLFDLLPISRMKGFSCVQPLFSTPLHVTPDTYPSIYTEVYQQLMKIQEEYFSGKPSSELIIYSYLINFLVTFSEEFLESANLFPSVQAGKQQEYVKKFENLLEYIDEHYMDDLTLEQIASATGFSKFHFSRLFKQYTKSTFCDYLRYRRIKVSEMLLEQPELSITEVALQAGFPSISTFNRLFKEQKGCSPSEYRSMIKSIQFSTKTTPL